MLRLLPFLVAGCIVNPAFAHTGVGDTAGLLHGFLHPIRGVDHVLAMIAVGLFAALLRGRALWLVPVSFVTMMAVSGTLAMTGVRLPLGEFGVGLSVAALGAVIAFRVDMPVAAAMAFVGFFAIFHGYVHGAEMPETASGLQYGIGFLLATALLHACGVGLGVTLGALGEVSRRRIMRSAGAAMVLAGIGFVAAMI